MADKERLSRLRLVDQNRERRRQERGQSSEAVSAEAGEQDSRLLQLLHTLYSQCLVPAAASRDRTQLARAAFTFTSSLLFQLMGQRDLTEVAAAAHTEVGPLGAFDALLRADLLKISL